MTSTDTTPVHAPTVYLAGIGDVPALPAALVPVAVAAADMPAGTWGVVAWPGDHDRPTLVEHSRQNVIAAQRCAADYAAGWDTERVYLVRRCPAGATVHTRDYGHPGHLIGSLPLAADDDGHADGWHRAWHHAMCSVTGDPARDDEHTGALLAAWRQAHRLPADAPVLAVVDAVAEAPRSDREYLTAYVRVLAAGLHEHAQHRTVSTHRAHA